MGEGNNLRIKRGATAIILRYILYLYITTIPTTIDLAEYPFIYI